MFVCEMVYDLTYRPTHRTITLVKLIIAKAIHCGM